jgi:hypothetical protein
MSGVNCDLHNRDSIPGKQNDIFLSFCDLHKLHNEKLNDPNSSPNIVRVIKSRTMRWVEHVARMGDTRGLFRVLMGKPEGKRPLGRPRRRWEDNIKMDLQEVGAWTGSIWFKIGTGGGHLWLR